MWDFELAYKEPSINSTWFRIIPEIILFLIEIRSNVVLEKVINAEKTDILVHTLWMKIHDVRKVCWGEEYRAFGLDLVENFLHELVINPLRWRMNQI